MTIFRLTIRTVTLTDILVDAKDATEARQKWLDDGNSAGTFDGEDCRECDIVDVKEVRS